MSSSTFINVNAKSQGGIIYAADSSASALDTINLNSITIKNTSKSSTG